MAFPIHVFVKTPPVRAGSWAGDFSPSLEVDLQLLPVGLIAGLEAPPTKEVGGIPVVPFIAPHSAAPGYVGLIVSCGIEVESIEAAMALPGFKPLFAIMPPQYMPPLNVGESLVERVGVLEKHAVAKCPDYFRPDFGDQDYHMTSLLPRGQACCVISFKRDVDYFYVAFENATVNGDNVIREIEKQFFY